MEDRRPKNSLLPQSMLDAGDAEWSTLRDLISRRLGELPRERFSRWRRSRQHTALFSSVGVSRLGATSVRCPAMASETGSGSQSDDALVGTEKARLPLFPHDPGYAPRSGDGSSHEPAPIDTHSFPRRQTSPRQTVGPIRGGVTEKASTGVSKPSSPIHPQHEQQQKEKKGET